VIRTLLFDLGNVIVPVDFSRCHQALAAVCPHPPQEVPRLVGGSGLARKYEKGQIATEEFVTETCRLLDMDVSFEQFWDLWGRIFLPEPLIPENVFETLRQRHRLLLLSNTNAMHFGIAKERYPLLRHFDGYVLSYEVGSLKPAPEIYREAIARAGCRPEECFFTDDLLANVEAARQEGMEAVQFQSFDQLQAELAARGILW
jgi:putative hydrolase of the HAD superfamily